MCALERPSESGRAQHLLIHATTRTTVRQLAVDHDGWHRPDAERLCTRCNVRVIHIVNCDLAGRTSRALHFNDFGAGRTARAEHLDFARCRHVVRSLECRTAYTHGGTLMEKFH